jgi:hypothetical protein
MSPPSSVSNNKPSKKLAELCLPPAFTLVSCSAYFSTLNMVTCSYETSIDFSGLRGVISQKIQIFVTATARTSNPTSKTYSFSLGKWISNTRGVYTAVRHGLEAVQSIVSPQNGVYGLTKTKHLLPAEKLAPPPPPPPHRKQK